MHELPPDRMGPEDRVRLESLIERLGWDRACPLFKAVANIDRRDRVEAVSHRDAQTLKVALATLAGDGPELRFS